jgi:hypothetical protein
MPLHVIWSVPIAPSSLNDSTAVSRATGLYRGVRANTEQTCLVRLPVLIRGWRRGECSTAWLLSAILLSETTLGRDARSALSAARGTALVNPIGEPACLGGSARPLPDRGDLEPARCRHGRNVGRRSVGVCRSGVPTKCPDSLLPESQVSTRTQYSSGTGWISPVVRSLAYRLTMASSKPSIRRACLGTIYGSNCPARSRGTCNLTAPTSVSSVLGEQPFR